MHRFIRAVAPIAIVMLTAVGTARAQVTAYATSSPPAGVQQLVRFNPTAPGTVTAVGATGNFGDSALIAGVCCSR
jgi:hypothetical protein